MARSRPSRRKKFRRSSVNSKIKDPIKPKWMRVAKIITMTTLSIIMVLAIAGIMIKYYRLISNHK